MKMLASTFRSMNREIGAFGTQAQINARRGDMSKINAGISHMSYQGVFVGLGGSVGANFSSAGVGLGVAARWMDNG